MLPQPISAGALVKVHMPGEWPMVRVLTMVAPHIIQGRIDSRLVATDMHGFSLGDVATFQWRDTPHAPGSFAWELSPKCDQLPWRPEGIVEQFKRNAS